MARKKKALTLPAARRQIKALTEQVETIRQIRDLAQAQHQRQLQDLKAQLSDKEDKMLPQKQALLKELSFLVNATSKAVRTTMWSIAPEKRRGW